MPLAEDQVPPGANWLTQRLTRIERAITELRAARGSGSTSFIGGAFRLLDAARAPRFTAGQVALDGSVSGVTSAYGVLIFADDGAVVVMTRQGTKGLAYPSIPIAMHPPTPIVVTSATFVNVVEAGVPRAAHEVLFVEGAWTVDAGVVAELKLADLQSGQETDTLQVTGPASVAYRFRWKHPGTIGLYENLPIVTNELFFVLLARRVSGAANTNIYPPRLALLTSTLLQPGATTSGGAEVLS
jgi:hypothetical protein